MFCDSAKRVSLCSQERMFFWLLKWECEWFSRAEPLRSFSRRAAVPLHLYVEIAERPPVYRVPCIRQQYIIYMYTCSAPAHDCRIISWQRLFTTYPGLCFFAAAFHGFSRLMLAIARLAQKELYSHAEPQRLLSRRDDTYERMSSLRGLRPFGGENRETFGLCREYEEI